MKPTLTDYLMLAFVILAVFTFAAVAQDVPFGSTPPPPPTDLSFTNTMPSLSWVPSGTNVGCVANNLIHNGSEVSLLQTGFEIVDSIVVDGTVIPYDGILAGFPSYALGADWFIWNNGSGTWSMATATEQWNQASTDTFPPKTNWGLSSPSSDAAPTGADLVQLNEYLASR